MDNAAEILSRHGSMAVPKLVENVLQVRPMKTGKERLGRQLFRLAKRNQRGLTVVEYPSYRLKKSRELGRYPRQGYAGEAAKVLASSEGYLELREILRRTGRLRGGEGDPEYWCYCRLADDEVRGLFSRLGDLKLGFPTPVRGETRARRGAAVPDSISQGIHETHLEGLIAENLDRVEAGLSLEGRQYYAPPVGRIDLLCRDKCSDFVVIEVKKFGASTNAIVDQLTRYMGWVKEHLAASGQKVRGILIVGKADERLAYSIKAIPGVAIKRFELSVKDDEASG